MEFFKRSLALVMAILMASFCLVGCKNETGDSGTTPQTEATTSGEPEVLAEPCFDLVDASGTPCIIVYPEGAGEKLVEMAEKTASRLKTFSVGTQFKVISESEIAQNPGRYIFIGNIYSVESQELINELKYSDVGYRVFPNGVLCVAGHGEEMDVKAVQHLWSAMTTTNIVFEKTLSNGEKVGGCYFLTADKNVKSGKYTIGNLKIGSVDVEDYSLVYGSDYEKEVAERLRDAIGNATGAVLTLKSSAYAESENEILVGKTGRLASKKFNEGDDALEGHEYIVKIESGKLVINADNELMLGFAADYLIDTYFSSKTTVDTLELTSSNDNRGSTTSEGFDLIAKDSGDIRILSSNVYFEDQTVDRANAFIEALPLYNADVVCLQEMDTMWHFLLDERIPKLGYTAVPTVGTGKYADKKHQDNYTPIYYRADKYELIDCGYQPYSSVGDSKTSIFTKYEELASLTETQKQNILKEYIKGGTEYGLVAHLSKSFSWAVLESKETGERFAVVSTHMTHDNSATVANIRRKADARELLAKVEDIKAEYDIPMICMGDYNFNLNETPYRIMTEKMKDAYRTAENKEYRGTTHKLGEDPSAGGDPIDLCFHTDDINPNKIQVVINEKTVFYSDHLPVVFDFSIKE